MAERKTEFLKFIRERFYADKPISREDFEHLYRLAERGAKVPDEATYLMLKAAFVAWGHDPCRKSSSLWKAMLSAALGDKT